MGYQGYHARDSLFSYHHSEIVVTPDGMYHAEVQSFFDGTMLMSCPHAEEKRGSERIGNLRIYISYNNFSTFHTLNPLHFIQ